MNTNNIMVSIVCNAYNHEKYIKDALDSFLMQKTNFPYEILIHDDASTDSTASIIKEYESLYPDLIKAIYQTENKYSKGEIIDLTYQYPRAKGKYIALCEGDDFWTDPYKLQKQVDALEHHPEVDICAHASYRINATTGRKIQLSMPKNIPCIISANEVILGGGDYVNTNTLMFRATLNDNIPKFRYILCIDYTLQIHGSLRGGMLFLPDIMSCYRFLCAGSWTKRIGKEIDKYNLHSQLMQNMMVQLNLDTKSIYKKEINTILNEIAFNKLRRNQQYKKALCKQYRSIFKVQPFKRKVKIIIGALLFNKK